jgi:tripartite-type tricarboxylate transporter receptor subunit TctC
MKKLILILLSGLLSLSLCAEPIEFVVSASAGGPNDTVTRKLVEALKPHTQLQFVVSNRPGAAHTIGYSYVNNATKPVLILSTPEVAAHEVYPKLNEVYNLGYFYNNLFVSEKSGIKNFKHLADISATREIAFGHGGVGTFSHSAMQQVCTSQLKCLAVPYKSGANGMLALLSGEIDAYALASYGSQQFLENNKVVPIYKIRASKDKAWFKLFAKNLSVKEVEELANGLKALDKQFYLDLGFEK